MNRTIINNKTDLSGATALEMIIKVISYGRISNNNKQYCYVTVYKIGELGYQVSTKLGNNSDIFTIIETSTLNE